MALWLRFDLGLFKVLVRNYSRVHRHQVESTLPRNGSWCSVNFIDRLNSHSQPDDYRDNTP
jgi:hypothetical protein